MARDTVTANKNKIILAKFFNNYNRKNKRGNVFDNRIYNMSLCLSSIDPLRKNTHLFNLILC